MSRAGEPRIKEPPFRPQAGLTFGKPPSGFLAGVHLPRPEVVGSVKGYAVRVEVAGLKGVKKKIKKMRKTIKYQRRLIKSLMDELKEAKMK